MVTGHTGTGAVSKFQTWGHTVTCYCGVMGFYSVMMSPLNTLSFRIFSYFTTNLFSFFINFSYFHVIQLSKNGNFDGSWFAGKVNLNYLNKYCIDLDDFVCIGTAWTRQTGQYKTFNKMHKFWARNCRKMVILMVHDCWLSKS